MFLAAKLLGFATQPLAWAMLLGGALESSDLWRYWTYRATERI